MKSKEKHFYVEDDVMARNQIEAKPKRIERWVLTKEVIDEMNKLRKKLGLGKGNYHEGQVLEVLIK